MRGRENKGQGKVIKSREKEHIDRKSNGAEEKERSELGGRGDKSSRGKQGRLGIGSSTKLHVIRSPPEQGM